MKADLEIWRPDQDVEYIEREKGGEKILADGKHKLKYNLST